LVFEMEVVTFKSKDFIIKGLKGYKTGWIKMGKIEIWVVKSD
jgi:hypothetical protein